MRSVHIDGSDLADVLAKAKLMRSVVFAAAVYRNAKEQGNDSVRRSAYAEMCRALDAVEAAQQMEDR
jgi:hypothetical protein